MIAAAGLTHPSQLRPHHLVRRVSHNKVELASALLAYLRPGQLLDASAHDSLPAEYAYYWPLARADSFVRSADRMGIDAH